MFKPENLAKFKDCGVHMLDSADDILSAALNYLGLNPNSKDPADLEKAGALLPRDPALQEISPEEDPRKELVDRLLDLLDEDDARHAADPGAPVYGATPDVADLDVMPWEITGELHQIGRAHV